MQDDIRDIGHVVFALLTIQKAKLFTLHILCNNTMNTKGGRGVLIVYSFFVTKDIPWAVVYPTTRENSLQTSHICKICSLNCQVHEFTGVNKNALAQGL